MSRYTPSYSPTATSWSMGDPRSKVRLATGRTCIQQVLHTHPLSGVSRTAPHAARTGATSTDNTPLTTLPIRDWGSGIRDWGLGIGSITLLTTRASGQDDGASGPLFQPATFLLLEDVAEPTFGA